MKPKRVTLFGPFLQNNLGDKLITESVLTLFTDNRKDIILFSLGQRSKNISSLSSDSYISDTGRFFIKFKNYISYLGRKFPVYTITLKTLPFISIKIFFSIFSSDAVVIRAIFQDFGKFRVMVSEIGVTVIFTFFARMLHKKIFFIGSSLEPVNTLVGRVLVKIMIKWAHRVCIRDYESSISSLVSLAFNKEKAYYTADLLFSNGSSIFRTNDITKKGEKIILINCIPVRKLGYINTITDIQVRRFINALYMLLKDIGYTIFFFGMTDHDLEMVSNNDGSNPFVNNILLFTTKDELCSWYKKADLVIASRYHACISALILNKPCIMLDYHKKVKSLSWECDWQKWTYCYEILNKSDIPESVFKLCNNNEYQKMKKQIAHCLFKLQQKSLENYREILCVE